MNGRRITGLAAGVALAISATVAVTIASGSPSGAAAPANEIRLQIAGSKGAFTYGSVTQSLEQQKNTCALKNVAQTIFTITPTGPGNASAGVTSGALGVKGSPSSGNGTPCAQIETSETLTLKTGSALGGRLIKSVQLDLEMTGNAIVKLTLSGAAGTRTYTLQTGTSIDATQSSEADYDRSAPYDVSSTDADNVDGCAAPNSSGPNSGANDNCRWAVTPGILIDTVKLTTTTGTVALEGGEDFAGDTTRQTVFNLANAAPNALDDIVFFDEVDPATFNVLTNDTDADGDPLSIVSFTQPDNGTVTQGSTPGQFTYTLDGGFFGPDEFTYTISDGAGNTDTATVHLAPEICTTEPVSDTDGDVSGTFTRLTDSEDCKVYTLDANDADDTILFQPAGDAIVAYRGELNFGPKPSQTGVVSDTLTYDKFGDFSFSPVPWCANPTFDGDGKVVSATISNFPTDTWCIAKAETVGAGAGFVETTWQVYGMDDPRFQ